MIDRDIINIIPSKMAAKYSIVPIKDDVNEIYLLTFEDSLGYRMKDDLTVLLGKNIHFLFKSVDEIKTALNVNYLSNDKNVNESFSYSTDIVDLIEEATELRASDIHIEAYEEKYRIRFRIDGKLFERHQLKKNNFLEIVNKIKIKALIDITEKRLPQDGRIKNSEMDLRVNVLPTLHGEKVVLRLLGNDATSLDLNNLGLTAQDLSVLRKNIIKPNGIILISGPTGSGKTTTLYAALNELNTSEKNIVTIEDPIEYTLPGINQVQLKENIGLTFESALRAFLRQDPDIIMLGEIRDGKTAKMAMRASLTGHLVLSTIHTNSASGIISRLVDMEIPRYLIKDTLNLAIAQRLLRLLCEDCKVQIVDGDIPKQVQEELETSDDQILYKPKGCTSCNHSGYKGRKAIYDIIEIKGDVVDKITASHSKDSNKKETNQLFQKALKLFKDGKTSYSEALSVK